MNKKKKEKDNVSYVNVCKTKNKYGYICTHIGIRNLFYSFSLVLRQAGFFSFLFCVRRRKKAARVEVRFFSCLMYNQGRIHRTPYRVFPF
jgi:hypothetical protein